jgi:Na+/melibiose symporter-like transporter
MIANLGFSKTVLILAVPAFLTMVPIHFKVKERILHPMRDEVTLKSMFEAIARNKYLLAFNSSFIVLMGTNFALAIGPYFLKWNLGNLNLLGIVIIAAILPMLFLPVLLPILIRTFGKRKLYIYGISIGIVMSVVQYYAGYHIFPLFLLIFSIKFIGLFLPMMMMSMFTADCAEYGAFVTGKRNEGITFSIQSLSNELGSAIAGSLSVLLLGFFGYDGTSKVQTQAAFDGIWLIISILPAIGMIVAFSSS